MYMVNNSIKGAGFIISDVMSAVLHLVIFDRDVKPIIDEKIVGMKRGGLIMRPLDGKPEVRKFMEDKGDVTLLVNLGCDGNVMMIEDDREDLGLTHRMFVSVSEYNSEKFLLASEPPHWMSQDDIHFLYKFGRPASSVPEKQMTFEEATMFQLERMKASLMDPGTSLREAQAEALEELRDLHAVIVDDENDEPSEEELLMMSPEEREETMLKEMHAAKCSYTDLMASLSVLFVAEERKKRQLREEE